LSRSTINVNIGSAATVFESASTTEWFGGVQLNLKYRLSSPQVEITRSCLLSRQLGHRA
jgi:hypothetical protein